ncbi:hypothetical protein Pyn_13273 [Prunus yedoensis var. nudiflora]|uniref:Uncharacterized protein n=1 Tax=Prunus yedoensis var. nudiflora TaxID=2094558 RepID=A0A314ZIP5_PRUYE|nr:hypothetical protein Pyn_13273 [Prunus yedoensis var. nudiflora]
MNKKHNELVSKLEVERERGKALQKRMKAKAKEISSSAEAAGSTGSSSSSSKSQLQGWWESPFEELDLKGLKQLHASFQHLRNDLRPALTCLNNLNPH